MGLLQTACLSDWFEFMIRVLRHDRRGTCYSEPHYPEMHGEIGGNDRATYEKCISLGTSFAPRNAGLSLKDWFEFMIRMLRHDSCHSEPPLPRDAWRDRNNRAAYEKCISLGDFICTQKCWFKFK
ncbi:hypothetical protein CEXT_181601 [Caerostris extrusa]|uniref:Uncharacterized protein n=1 Tax=Caerostris extrusa TaxID=172846 RepID=A0AAV4VYV9_CAEEX|nr:hypothetical protein CEXT_181601 [Caerostris extrusa]